MTAPELVPKKGRGDGEHEDATRPELERPAGRPASRRTVRRWEFGVFIRKIVNGWLAYYKQFPPGSASEGHAVTRHASSAESAEGGDQDSFFTGPVQPLSGHARGGDDGGPAGQASLEAGLFLRSTTDATDEESDDS